MIPPQRASQRFAAGRDLGADRAVPSTSSLFSPFKPTLRKAAEKLDGLRTAEGTPLLENTRAELSRHLARLRVVREQIRAIEQKRLHKLAAAPAEENGPHVMVRLIARVFGVGVETADMLVNPTRASPGH
jgi:hypothetical protein